MTFGTIQNTPEKYDMWAWSADSPMPCWFTLFALFTAETPSNQKLVLKKKKERESLVHLVWLKVLKIHNF